MRINTAFVLLTPRQKNAFRDKFGLSLDKGMQEDSDNAIAWLYSQFAKDEDDKAIPFDKVLDITTKEIYEFFEVDLEALTEGATPEGV